MDQHFQKVVQDANMAFTMKLNSVSFLFLIPFVLFIGINMFIGSPFFTYFTILYLAVSLIFTFSKMKITLAFRRVILNKNPEVVSQNLDFLINYFEADTFFNRLMKKQQQKILINLHQAYEMLLIDKELTNK